MSSAAATPTIGHNRPPEPIVIETEDRVLADLRYRHPEMSIKVSEWDAALATYPTKLTLADGEQAAAMGDLLGQIETQQNVWKALRSSEKKRWNRIVSVIQNFFAKGEELCEERLTKWRPIHQEYLSQKNKEKERLDREAAEHQRLAAEEAQMDALWKDAEAELAEWNRQDSLRRAEEARLAELDAKDAQMWSEAYAENAAHDASKAERQRKDAERAGREENATNLRAIKALHKEATQLAKSQGELSIGEDFHSDARFDDLVLEHGEIAKLGRSLLHSVYIEDEQRSAVEVIRADLVTWRAERVARLDDAQRLAHDRRAQEAQEQEARAEKVREMHRLGHCLLMWGVTAVKAARDKADAEAVAAKAATKSATADVRATKQEAQEATTEARTAQREAGYAGKDADRQTNRADRMERRVETTTAAERSRTRGDLGTVSSLTHQWEKDIFDYDALRAVSGPLGPYLSEEDITGAVHRWMMERRGEWSGKERMVGLLPGVTFIYAESSRIKV